MIKMTNLLLNFIFLSLSSLVTLFLSLLSLHTPQKGRRRSQQSITFHQSSSLPHSLCCFRTSPMAFSPIPTLYLFHLSHTKPHMLPFQKLSTSSDSNSTSSLSAMDSNSSSGDDNEVTYDLLEMYIQFSLVLSQNQTVTIELLFKLTTVLISQHMSLQHTLSSLSCFLRKILRTSPIPELPLAKHV